MEITIAQSLKRLRSEKGNTQEELAAHLMISAQAVSKWERGDGMPDIAFLPRIASFYDTTVDDLLGCEEVRRGEELAKFAEQVQSLSADADLKERLALCRRAYARYPNEAIVLQNLSFTLYEEDVEKNGKEIVHLAQKLLEKGDLEQRVRALQILSLTHDALGDYEQAVAYASMVPTQCDLLISVLKGEVLVQHCRQYFWDLCEKARKFGERLISTPEANYTDEEKHKMERMIYDLFYLVFDDGDFGFWEARLARICERMALFSTKMGKIEQAFEELDAMCSHFEKFFAFSSIDHTSLFVRDIHYTLPAGHDQEKKITGESYVERLKRPVYGALHDDPRFANIVERLALLK
ncbi:MAG: helix-turn-helix transcriptional regulator [Clostridia bacterium]|nr:helix-turn-helix transcriptional regulator [Clostridia bacterium]